MPRAKELIEKQKTVMLADAERMARRPKGVSRFSWRCDNRIEYLLIHAADTAFKTKPERTMCFDLNGSATDLWIWSMPRDLGKRPFLVERIDLSAEDADDRLSRYAITGIGKLLEL